MAQTRATARLVDPLARIRDYVRDLCRAIWREAASLQYQLLHTYGIRLTPVEVVVMVFFSQCQVRVRWYQVCIRTFQRVSSFHFADVSPSISLSNEVEDDESLVPRRTQLVQLIPQYCPCSTVLVVHRAAPAALRIQLQCGDEVRLTLRPRE